MLSLSEALQQIDSLIRPLGSQSVPLQSVLGRTLAEDLCSDVDVPPHIKSLVDGYAVRSTDVTEPETNLKVVDEVVAGGWPNCGLSAGQATRIMTGAAVPDGADAIVMVEQSTMIDDDEVRLDASHVAAGQNIMARGKVMWKGEVVLRRGVRISASTIGLLAEIGQAHVPVAMSPRVAIISTGNELVPPESQPGPGQIRNSNGPMLAAAIEHAGGQLMSHVHCVDDAELLAEAMRDGLRADIMVLSGGVSAGKLDLVPAELQACGVKEVFHKVSLKPGKPIWFGTADRNGHRCLVFGLPGNPVSSLVCFQLFVRRAMQKMMGDAAADTPLVRLPLRSSFEHRGPRPTYWPARLIRSKQGEMELEPLPWSGSGDLRTVAQADGWIGFAAGDRTYQASERVSFLATNG